METSILRGPRLVESLGLLAGFGLSFGKLKERYERTAVPQLRELTALVENTHQMAAHLTPEQARQELKELSAVLPVFVKLREYMEPEPGKSGGIQEAAYNFIDAVLHWAELLEDVANVASKEEVQLLEVRFDRLIRFNRPISVLLWSEGGHWIAENEEFNVVAWADTREEALSAFAFSFEATYDNYALEDYDNLDESAFDLKERLLNLVANEEQEA